MDKLISQSQVWMPTSLMFSPPFWQVVLFLRIPNYLSFISTWLAILQQLNLTIRKFMRSTTGKMIK